jgi:hypothetical protein
MLTNPAHVADNSHGITLMWWQVPGPLSILPAVVVWYDNVARIAATGANTPGVIKGLDLFRQRLHPQFPQLFRYRCEMFADKVGWLLSTAYRGDG